MFVLQVTMTATLPSHVIKHLRLCFHFCKLYNNQTRPDDRPRSLAGHGDIITTSRVIDCFFANSICASTTKSDQYSLMLHDDDINHQQIKGQVLIALSLVLSSSNTQTRKILEKTGIVNNRYALLYNVTERKLYFILIYKRNNSII